MQEDMCIFSQSTSMKRLLVFTSGPLVQTSQFLLKNNQTTLVFPEKDHTSLIPTVTK